MKHAQRLDDGRLAEVLHDRGMADLDAIRELLQQSQSGTGASFAEALVNTGKVADWDLSCVVAEVFNLPFLPVDVCNPDPAAAEGLDVEFLIENGLVPIGRSGQVLTISMPGLVAADVLGMLAAETDLVILPVVGSVETNRRWIESNLVEGADATAPTAAKAATPAAPSKSKAKSSGAKNENDAGWGNMFDDANAAVMMDLESAGDELEFEVSVDDEVMDFDPPSLVDSDVSEEVDEEAHELPPMPEFE